MFKIMKAKRTRTMTPCATVRVGETLYLNEAAIDLTNLWNAKKIDLYFNEETNEIGIKSNDCGQRKVSHQVKESGTRALTIAIKEFSEAYDMKRGQYTVRYDAEFDGAILKYWRQL